MLTDPKMVVERQSATLGYDNEISKPLVADHHTVCKFDNIYDSNYMSVRNALKSLVSIISFQGLMPCHLFHFFVNFFRQTYTFHTIEIRE